MKNINIADPVQRRRVHVDLMNEVNCEAIFHSNKYNVQINSLYFEWDRFIAKIERQFPDVLNQVLSCDHQWHL